MYHEVRTIYRNSTINLALAFILLGTLVYATTLSYHSRTDTRTGRQRCDPLRYYRVIAQRDHSFSVYRLARAILTIRNCVLLACRW